MTRTPRHRSPHRKDGQMEAARKQFQAVIESRLRGMREVHVEQVSWVEEGEPGRWIDIVVSGWSPTFHRVESRWTIDMAASRLRIWRALSSHVSRQRALRRAARRSGIALPLPQPWSIAGRDLGHLRIGAVEAEIMVELWGPDTTIAELSNALEYLMDGCDDTGNQNDMMGYIALVSGWPVLCTYVDLDDDQGTIHDNTLSFSDQLPETLLTAIVGHPIGDLVATGHHALDRAIVIATGTARSGRTWLEFDDRHIRIDEHPALAAALAELPEVSDDDAFEEMESLFGEMFVPVA